MYIFSILGSSIQYPTIYNLHKDWLLTRVYGRIEAGKSFEDARADYNRQVLSKRPAEPVLAG